MLAVGILLKWVAYKFDGVWAAVLSLIGFLLISTVVLSVIVWCIVNPRYTETARYELRSYSIETIDTRRESARRCTATLMDGDIMVVDLREICQEGNKVVLVQYSDTRHKSELFKWKNDYVLLLPDKGPAESAPQQPETSMKKTSTDPHE